MDHRENISKISSIQKTNTYSIYVFTKGLDFTNKILKFLLDLGLSDAENSLGLYDNDEKHTINLSGWRKVRPLNLAKLVDVRKQVANEDYNIFIIFGSKKVFMLVLHKPEKQKEISDKLLRYFKLKEVE